MFDDSRLCWLLMDKPHHGISINNLTPAPVSASVFTFSTRLPFLFANWLLLRTRYGNWLRFTDIFRMQQGQITMFKGRDFSLNRNNMKSRCAKMY